jgi:hypothetical protein
MFGLIFLVVPLIIFAGFVFVGISVIASTTKNNARTVKRGSTADRSPEPWTRPSSPEKSQEPDDDFEGSGSVRGYEGSEIMYKENAVDELHSIERPDRFWEKENQDFVEGHLEHDKENKKKR